jgi:hypothetical protein
MSLKNLLLEKKKSILRKWFNLILETYPSETIQFLKSQKDRFANPVGSIIFQGIENIFDQFFQEGESEKISTFLDNVIRIRAVQDFTASQAVIFIFHLKKVIREELKNEIREKALYDELFVLESEIDDLALLSFDIFMKCREQVYELKANEVKNMTYSLLKKANLIYDIKEQEPATKNDNVDNFTEKR